MSPPYDSSARQCSSRDAVRALLSLVPNPTRVVGIGTIRIEPTATAPNSLIRQRFPHDKELWLPEAPMRRHRYLYARTRWLTDPGILAELRVMHRRLTAEQARSLGLLEPDGPGSWTHSLLSRMLYEAPRDL